MFLYFYIYIYIIILSIKKNYNRTLLGWMIMLKRCRMKILNFINIKEDVILISYTVKINITKGNIYGVNN